MAQSKSAMKAKEPPNCQVVGPILGASRPGEIRIVIGLPHLAYHDLSCIVEGGSGMQTEPQAAKRGHGLFGVYEFQFKGLTPGAEYRYRFEANGHPIDLQFGLTQEDCWFKAPSEFTEKDSFVMMSCHNPFETKKGSADEGWAMWKELKARVESDPSIRFLVLGGDQVYNDDVEQECLPKIRKRPDDANLHDSVRERFFRQYQLFWEDLNYRKVMARVPSIAMWDDHDITDGWGGNLASFAGCEISPEWCKYFDLASEAFNAYQASRNPTPLQGIPGKARSFCFDFGENRIYMLDHRTERNCEKRVLWSKEHKRAFEQSLAAIADPIKRVFVLCPTVPFRTNFELDRRLGWWTRKLFEFVQWLERRDRLRRFLFWVLIALTILWPLCFVGAALDYLDIVDLSGKGVEYGKLMLMAGSGLFLIWTIILLTSGLAEAIIRIPELPKLTDDLDDGLSSEANRGSLKDILYALFDLKRKNGLEVVILSGDIHLAGASEVVQDREGQSLSILQVVSSPIAYQPMPKVAEGFSSTTSEMVLEDGERDKLYARNIFYTSKRNFAQVFPGRIKAGSSEAAVYFFMEGHRLPLCIPACFTPQSKMAGS